MRLGIVRILFFNLSRGCWLVPSACNLILGAYLSGMRKKLFHVGVPRNGFDGTLEIISRIAMRKKKLWKILAFIVKFMFLCCMSSFLIHICHAPSTIRFHPIDAYEFFLLYSARSGAELESRPKYRRMEEKRIERGGRAAGQHRRKKNQWSKGQRLLILGSMYPIKLQLDEI